jgi:NADH:ubiquinone oxidoreductase subunit E
MASNECCSCQTEVSEEDLLKRLEENLEDYVGVKGGLIPALQLTQVLLGYIPTSAMELISDKLGYSMSKIFGVVTFYSFFSRSPRGKYVVRVCLGTACYVRGGSAVLDALKDALGIGIGETTEDRLFSLDIGRCFGACGLAPVIMVNDDVHQRVKPSQVTEVLEEYRAKELVPVGGDVL